MERAQKTKKSTYIRTFKTTQLDTIEKISKLHNIKSVSRVLIFTLERFLDNERHIRLLKMNNKRKEMQIGQLSEEVIFLRSQNDDLMKGIID